MPSLYRPPGYPLFLAAQIALWGPDLPAIRAVQLLLSLGFIPLAERLLRLLGAEEGTLSLGLLLVATNPLLFLFGLLLQSDSLFYLLFAWAQVELIAGSAATGLAVGLASLVRGEAFYTALLCLPALGRRRALRTLAVCLLVLLPWTVRNLASTGQLVLLQRGTLEVSLLNSFDPEGTGVACPDYAAWKADTMAGYVQLPDAQRPGWLRARLLTFIPEHWSYYGRAGFNKVAFLYAPIPPSLRAGPLTTAALWLSYGLLIPFFLLGLAHCRRRQPRAFAVIAVCLLANLAAGLLATTGLRVRLQVHFLFLCLAAIGLGKSLAPAPKDAQEVQTPVTGSPFTRPVR